MIRDLAEAFVLVSFVIAVLALVGAFQCVLVSFVIAVLALVGAFQ